MPHLLHLLVLLSGDMLSNSFTYNGALRVLDLWAVRHGLSTSKPPVAHATGSGIHAAIVLQQGKHSIPVDAAHQSCPTHFNLPDRGFLTLLFGRTTSELPFPVNRPQFPHSLHVQVSAAGNNYEKMSCDFAFTEVHILGDSKYAAVR